MRFSCASNCPLVLFSGLWSPPCKTPVVCRRISNATSLGHPPSFVSLCGGKAVARLHTQNNSRCFF